MIEKDTFEPFIYKLKSCKLRPTRQRLLICKILFDNKNTFHFTVEELNKIVKKNTHLKISTATLYNTVNVFKKHGYLKEIIVSGNKKYFDTNISNHHHFYDEHRKDLTDVDINEVIISKVPKTPKGKKIKSMELLITTTDDHQNQKN